MQELILIGVVGLIVLGPRKLPQLAKTIGKTMADFRKITGEFKSTWEREVEEDSKLMRTFASDPEMDSPTIKPIEQPSLIAPQVKELNPADIEKLFPQKKLQNNVGEVEEIQTETKVEKLEEPQPEPVILSKRDWL
jgi:sec-independent protein translocase protein TatB